MISEQVDALVCDLDGVMYRGEVPVPGSAAAVARLRAAGVRFLFCTNNSRWTDAQYVDKLERIGVPVTPEEILSSAAVTGDEVRRRGLGGSRGFLIGGDGIREHLEAAGVELLPLDDAEGAELVVLGADPEFTYEDVRVASNLVRAGAVFLATNSDATYPAPEGLRPGAGAMLAAVEVAAGHKAEVMGKPFPPIMAAAARRLEGADRIGVVGDQPATDLAGARARGWLAILVLSGVTSVEEVAAADPQPDLVVAALAALAAPV